VEKNNYNIALELLAGYKYELKRQINRVIDQRKSYLDNLLKQADDCDIREFDLELVRLEDSLYELDTFLMNFA
jgi:hypothetical protein